MDAADVTILIPLHESARHVDTIRGNLSRLIGSATIVISDATGRDETLRLLEREWAGRGVRFLGPRSLRPGWVAHYNDLLAHASTERFLWLPHDDEIDREYVDILGRILDQTPEAAAACGGLDAIAGPGLDIVPQPRLPTLAPERFRCRANQLLLEWNLGVMFRGLFRRSLVGPIPHTTPTDEWADIVWLYGISLEHPLVQTLETTYRKRFAATTTHAAWRSMMHPLALPYLVREVTRRERLHDQLMIIEQLVAGSIAQFELQGGSIQHTVAEGRRSQSSLRGWQQLWQRMASRPRR